MQYIQYTPAQGKDGGGPQQRIIQIVEEQKDPMEPARFRTNQKLPRPPPSPPAPVLRSPAKRPTVQQQKEWKIPPCISNWKNPRGYVIPLDKRLMTDGRGLQQVHINENFAKMSEALYIAEKKAREAVNLRAQMEFRIAKTKKDAKEKEMREIALKTREERLAAKHHGGRGKEKESREYKEREDIRRDRLDEFRKERRKRKKHHQ